jgi:UDPglucose--hexose-1-phosphate uridylyltransferase
LIGIDIVEKGCLLAYYRCMDIRIDPITNQPVIMATRRSQRPHFGKTQPAHAPLDAHRMVDRKLNPFAPGNEHLTGPEVYADSDNMHRLANQPDWKVRVVRNKYPIVEHHEVIVLSPDAKKDISQVSHKQAHRIVRAFVQRSKAMEKHGYAFLFCNHGAAAGASIDHPHAQVMALPALSPIVRREIDALKAAYDTKGQCLHCRLVESELRIAKRLVWQNDDFVIICPESSGWPYALSVYPKIHQASLAAIKEEQSASLAQAIQTAVGLYNQVLKQPAYNYWAHGITRHFYHWHLDFVPRTKVLAGVELGAGIMVNDRLHPEAAAKEFRLALKDMK